MIGAGDRNLTRASVFGQRRRSRGRRFAHGRDFRDVPPNKGTWRGKAKESIEVGVESEELEEIPPELAAERVQALSIPVYPTGAAGHRDFANQQQEHQQQQERDGDLHQQQSQQQQQGKC